MKNNRECEIFTGAVQLSGKEREAYLDDACAGDADLRGRVEELLSTNDLAGRFMEEPQTNSIGELWAKVTAGERPGDRVDRYKLLEQIGEGGCGVVFMAEQEKPVRRRVALKIIKPGMDTKSVIARFEAERQALALMDHPNIAKVFDAGSTQSGRPYFVMELVRGVRINQYCDEHSLTIEKRLGLFTQVCHAVQHAHQRGIIHRDIKPSNILVAEGVDGTEVPVVIDFGIAKATTNQPLTDKTLFTAFEMLIGTPAYMSPEQAAFNTLNVDTRTDIYSLGVLLYELLAGATPFDTNALVKSELDEIRRVIREEEPARPSTRLIRMSAADQMTIARHRRTEPAALIHSLSGDLDWIVMKAMEKDRTRRYETASELAMDVKRLLTHEAVLARPPSNFYRLKKTVQRHRWFFLSASVVAIITLAALAVVSILLAYERKAHLEAETALDQSKAVTKLVKEMLEGAGPSAANGQDTGMLRDILDRTARRIGTELTAQPAVEAEMRKLISHLYLDIGRYEAAEQMDLAALEIEKSLYTEEDPHTADSFYHLGLVYWKEGKLGEAEQAQTKAFAIRRNLFPTTNADFASSLNALGSVYTDEKKYDLAEPMIRQGLQIRQQLFPSNNVEVASSLESLCRALEARGRWTDAEAVAQQFVDMCRQIPKRPDLLAEALGDLAMSAGLAGRVDLQESADKEAFAIKSKILPEEHPYVAKAIADIGDLFRFKGNTIEAHAVLLAAVSIQTKLLGEDYPDTIATMGSLGMVLESEGKWEEAETVHRRALMLSRKRLGDEDGRTRWEFGELAHVLTMEKKYDEANRLLRDILYSKAGQTQDCASLWGQESELMGRLGRWREAAADATHLCKLEPKQPYHFHRLAALLVAAHDYSNYTDLCHEILERFGDETNPYAAARLANSCLLLGDSGLDLKLVDRLATCGVTKGENDDAVDYFQGGKALSEYRQGRFSEAARWANESLQGRYALAKAKGYAVLAMAHWQLGEKDAAKAALAKGEKLAPALSSQAGMIDLGDDWLNWLFARITLEEAATLLASEQK